MRKVHTHLPCEEVAEPLDTSRPNEDIEWGATASLELHLRRDHRVRDITAQVKKNEIRQAKPEEV
jgi:hypothetical protein